MQHGPGGPAPTGLQCRDDHIGEASTYIGLVLTAFQAISSMRLQLGLASNWWLHYLWTLLWWPTVLKRIAFPLVGQSLVRSLSALIAYTFSCTSAFIG